MKIRFIRLPFISALVAFAACLGAQGCMFVHDTACADDSDCRSGHSCNDGECVSSSGEGSGADSSSTPNGEGSSGTTKPAVTPECSISELGTALSADQSAALYNKNATLSLLVSTSMNQVTYVGGKACKLIAKPSFTSSAPCNDLYDCGGCQMLISKAAQAPEGGDITGMTQWVMTLWSPKTGSCASWNATYYLSSNSSGGGGSSSGGDACSRCSDACAGIPGCSCCAECGGFCFN